MANDAPTYSLVINGKPLPDDLADRLESWEYEDVEHTDKLTLTFDNRDHKIDEREEFAQENPVEWRHGYVGEMSDKFLLNIKSHSGWDKITITCLGVTHIFNSVQKTRWWKDASLDEVVGLIARENNLGTHYRTTEPKDKTGAFIKHDYFQPAIEDMAFLWNLARQIGYEVWMEWEDGSLTLFFMPRRYWQPPYMEYVYEGGDVEKFEPTMNTVSKRSDFAGAGIDLEEKSVFHSNENGTTREMYFLKDASGKCRLFDAEGANKQKTTVEEAFATRMVANNKKEMEELLAGAWMREQEDMITATLTVVGNPNLQARRVIMVSNVGKWSGQYYVKGVTHSGGNRAYKCVASLTRNSLTDKGEVWSFEAAQEIVNKGVVSREAFHAQKRKGPEWQEIKRLQPVNA